MSAPQQDPRGERVSPDRAGPRSQVSRPAVEARTAAFDPNPGSPVLPFPAGSQRRDGEGWS